LQTHLLHFAFENGPLKKTIKNKKTTQKASREVYWANPLLLKVSAYTAKKLPLFTLDQSPIAHRVCHVLDILLTPDKKKRGGVV